MAYVLTVTENDWDWASSNEVLIPYTSDRGELRTSS